LNIDGLAAVVGEQVYTRSQLALPCQTMEAMIHSNKVIASDPYTKISTSIGLPSSTKYASISNYAYNLQTLQSTCPIYQEETIQKPFLDTFYSISNHTLHNLHIDTDGNREWLIHSIINGTSSVCKKKRAKLPAQAPS
jgi:hypothetical protein